MLFSILTATLPKQKLLGRKMLHRKVFRHTWDAEKM
jgi:hypothetical protein